MDLVEQLSNHLTALSSLARTLQSSNVRSSEAEPSVSIAGFPQPQIQKRLDAGHVADLVTSYQAGTTVDDLAATYQINRTTVLAHLKRQGVKRRRSRLQRVDIDKAVHLYAAGHSVDSVARELRVGSTTVRRVLKARGVELRRQGRKRRDPVELQSTTE